MSNGNGSVHKLVFAPSVDELTKLLRKEARTGWYPTKFEPQPVKDGVLIVLEKHSVTSRFRAS